MFSSSTSNEVLRQQFQQMQEQRQNRLQQQRQKQQEMSEKAQEDNAEKEKDTKFAFNSGNDNLDLRTSNQNNELTTSEILQDPSDKIRELKDENGRLYKLLREKDQEIRQMKKKQEAEKMLAAAGASMITNDTAATKIVELSKKLRELTSELESERTKSKQFARKCEELTKEVTGNSSLNASNEMENKELDQHELKATAEKLKQAESKLMDLRNQIQTLKAELKISQKVLAQEVGDGVSMSSLVSGSSGWKGRALQISVLQKKVTELRKQLNEKVEHGSRGDMESVGSNSEFPEEMIGGASQQSARNNLTERHKEQIRKLEKQRKENQDRLAEELKVLEQRNMELKQKVEASKARNNNLSEEMKIQKKQNQLLTEKGKHDNELIEMLVKQQSQWKKIVEDNSKKVPDGTEIAAGLHLERNTIERLKTIITEKEEKIKSLENEIKRLKFHQSDPDSDCETSFARDKSSQRPKRQSDVTAEILAEVLSPNPSRAGSRSGSHFEVKPNTDSCKVNSNKDYHELNSLYQAMTVERDRLAELVQIQEKRLNDATFQAVEAQNELQTEKRRNAVLEKQLGKLKLERNPADGKQRNKKSGGMQSSVSIEDTVSEAARGLEEIQMKLDIQRDENEALKAALQSTLKAKEEDLRLYSGMLEETKKVFLMGIRQSRKTAS